MARKTEEKVSKSHSKKTRKPHQIIIFFFSSDMEEHLLFSNSTKLNLHSFGIHYIWRFFKKIISTLSTQSLLIFSEIIAQISCPPMGFPTCSLRCDQLWCLVLNHQFNNEALFWSLRLLPVPSSQIALQGFGVQRWMDIHGLPPNNSLLPGYYQTVPEQITAT